MSRRFAWRAYCEGCEWVGAPRPAESGLYFTESNNDARLDLAYHFKQVGHEKDGKRPDGQNIYSVGVELVMAKNVTSEKLHGPA